MLALATKLYGITFKENKHIPVYHPDVIAYDVFDKDESFLATLLVDFSQGKAKGGGLDDKLSWRTLRPALQSTSDSKQFVPTSGERHDQFYKAN